jgi:RHS repeat-associated protein
MLRERFNELTGSSVQLYHNMHYNRRGQLFDVRLGTSSTDEWTWNRGAIRVYFNSDHSDYSATPTYANNNGNLYRQEHFVPDNDAVSSWSLAVDYFNYDAINRVTLIAEQTYWSSGAANYNTFSQNFSYDRFGNRLISSMNVPNVPNPGFKIQCAVDVNNNCISSNNRLIAPTDVNGITGTDKMQYDLAGNLIKDSHTQAGLGTRTYDAENRMLTAVGANGYTHSYVYDADGRRVRRVINGTAPETWWQVYGVGGELVAEYQLVSGNPVLKKEYGQRNGQLLIIGDATNGTAQWLVTDALGTPRIIADQTRTLSGIKRHDYLPFGEEVFANVASHRATTNGYVANSSTTQPPRQQFTGYERDNETGLDFAQARYFSNTQGRFTSPDPLLASSISTDPQSWNRCSYVGNRPTAFIDPTGLIWGFISGNGGDWYQWFKDEEELKNAGATVVQANAGGPGHIYKGGGGWVRLNLNENKWTQYETSTQAFYDQREFPTAMGDLGSTLNLFGALQGGAGLAGSTLGRIFGSGGSGITTLGLSGATATSTAQATTGLSMEGVAFELKFLAKHLPGTAQAEKLIAKEGAAHVFNDISTLSRVEAEIFARGVNTGTTRGFTRIGLQFESPIGYRVAQDGTKTALHYAEIKMRANGLYHIIPRTGASK